MELLLQKIDSIHKNMDYIIFIPFQLIIFLIIHTFAHIIAITMIKLKEGFDGERSIVLPKIIIELLEKDPLASILHITDIGYYPKAEHHYRERKEGINQFVFIYCINGNGWFSVNGNRYEVHANQYFILPAGIPHAYASHTDTPWTIYWIHFKGTLASFYAEKASTPMNINPELHSRISHRIDMFEEIFNTLKNGYTTENLQYISSLFHHYLGSLRYLQQYRDANHSPIDDNNAIQGAIHYMKENLEKRLTLIEIAKAVGYSSSHFSIIFKKETGYAPLNYFNLLKIQQACFLLDTTEMKIKQICYKIGIEDAYYFSRLFRKIMGVSPRAYKKSQRG